MIGGGGHAAGGATGALGSAGSTGARSDVGVVVPVGAGVGAVGEDGWVGAVVFGVGVFGAGVFGVGVLGSGARVFGSGTEGGAGALGTLWLHGFDGEPGALEEPWVPVMGDAAMHAEHIPQVIASATDGKNTSAERVRPTIAVFFSPPSSPRLTPTAPTTMPKRAQTGASKLRTEPSAGSAAIASRPHTMKVPPMSPSVSESPPSRMGRIVGVCPPRSSCSCGPRPRSVRGSLHCVLRGAR